MKNKIERAGWLLIFLLCSLQACKKQLEAKPDQQLATPEKTADLQAILDYSPVMFPEPSADEGSADNYYLKDANLNGFSDQANKRIYTWDKDHFFDGFGSDWGIAYRKVYACNTVLDALKEKPAAAGPQSADLKGQALFRRAKTFWHIANTWAGLYEAATAKTDLGIPLRLDANYQQVSVRATVQQTYDRIISDLIESLPLLPLVAVSPTRPSKPAAFAMLARVYLSMRNYTQAKLYCDSTLAVFPALIDYNDLNAGAAFPFPMLNAETIIYNTAGSILITPSYAKMDTVLYASYTADDLRKTIFFKSLGGKLYSFKGSYCGNSDHFCGLATDEVYLTRAECLAREGKTAEALQDLNTLLVKRFKTGTFVPVSAADAPAALAKILEERRKELPMRFTRWLDLKRLNKDGAGIVLQRLVSGQLYELLPNSPRYLLPLPEDVIALTGMPQNPR